MTSRLPRFTIALVMAIMAVAACASVQAQGNSGKTTPQAAPSGGTPDGSNGDLQIKASSSSFGAYVGATCGAGLVRAVSSTGALTCAVAGVDYASPFSPFLQADHASIGSDLSEHGNVPLWIAKNYLSADDLHRAVVIQTSSLGNGTSFVGGGGGYVVTEDAPGVTDDNAGVLYGWQVSVRPHRPRNGGIHAPWNDANGLVITNDGTANGTSALFTGGSNGTWNTLFELSGTALWQGITMVDLNLPTGKAMVIPKGSGIYGTTVPFPRVETPLISYSADGFVQLGPPTRLTATLANGLPSCTSTAAGAVAYVTDSLVTSWGQTVVGGGVDRVLAFCNGAAWTVAGR